MDAKQGAAAAETKHIDPVCGMTVDREKAAGTVLHNGTAYYFCSPRCVERFKASPDAYVNPAAAPPASAAQPRTLAYICPMDPEVRQPGPGACPKCGMALEPDLADPAAMAKVEYTCPMHPEIVRAEPGVCPICGMALEPRTVSVADTPNPELVQMTRRFWIGTALTAPVFVLTMADMLSGEHAALVGMQAANWIGLACATPVVLWAGWPFFERAWASFVNRSPNMFTLIGMGVGAAYTYSVLG